MDPDLFFGLAVLVVFIVIAWATGGGEYEDEMGLP